MKHKLFLCILFLVIIGLYYQNCFEFFTQEEEKKIEDIFNNKYKNYLKANETNNRDAILNSIKDDIRTELIDSGKCIGPEGPKGDTGGEANIYQGLYTRDPESNILKLSISPTTLNEQVGTNNIIKLKPTKDSPLNLELGERWQRTKDDTLVYGDNSNFVMCYDKDKKKIGLCHSTNVNSKVNNINFNFLKDSQQIKVGTEPDICLDSDNNELIAKECNKESKTQQFFFH